MGIIFFYEIKNRTNIVSISLVIGVKDRPQEYKEFIDFLLQSKRKKVEGQKTYFIETFNSYNYKDEENISTVKDEITKRLNHIFETQIIECEKELKTLWTIFLKHRGNRRGLEENKICREITQEQYDKELESDIKRISKLSDTELNDRIFKSGTPELITTFNKVYKRNPAVVISTLRRANGYCEKCGCKAPFNRKSDNTPYLEVHHKVALSDGGLDNVENTIAVCPNCHREFHFGL